MINDILHPLYFTFNTTERHLLDRIIVVISILLFHLNFILSIHYFSVDLKISYHFQRLI